MAEDIWEGVQFEPNTPCVILDRCLDIAPEDLPYCVHGRTWCMHCHNMVYLGDATHRTVQAGKAMPLCQSCAQMLALSGLMKPEQRVGNVQDHRRADGPH